jgi:hypothetical protein
MAASVNFAAATVSWPGEVPALPVGREATAPAPSLDKPEHNGETVGLSSSFSVPLCLYGSTSRKVRPDA